ncbi:MAG: hypothetical protein LBC53_08975 [Spirochaetaceae bacterium]|jgi:hypothetical protein|nr:hypothetical protein [Spirochaetaceae bacterium]
MEARYETLGEDAGAIVSDMRNVSGDYMTALREVAAAKSVQKNAGANRAIYGSYTSDNTELYGIEDLWGSRKGYNRRL